MTTPTLPSQADGGWATGSPGQSCRAGPQGTAELGPERPAAHGVGPVLAWRKSREGGPGADSCLFCKTLPEGSRPDAIVPDSFAMKRTL